MKILLIANTAKELHIIEESFSSRTCTVVNATSVKTALAMLAKHQFSIIICMAELGKVSGLELLRAVGKKFSRPARFLVNNATSDISLEASQVAHSILAYPIDVAKLKTKIKNVGSQNTAITKKSIISAVKSVKTLPSAPKVYMQLNHILQSKHVDSDKIADIITQDPALAAKVLQFSNSAFIAKGNAINSITEAITRMGVEMLSCIVMTAELFVYKPSFQGFSIEDEQQHSLATAKFAASLVKPALKQQAMIAGLLHDIGKLVLFDIDPALTKRFFQEQSHSTDNILLERRMFNCDHCAVGAFLLHVWSFPYDLIAAITDHHEPKKLLSSDFGVSQAVYVANKLIKDQKMDAEFIDHYKLEKTLDALTKRAEKYRA